MDIGLLEAGIVLGNLVIVSIPQIIFKFFSNTNIPKDFDEFDKHYKNDIDKIEKHSIEKVSKKFDEAIRFKKIVYDENNNDEEKRDTDFLKQLYTHEVFFMELKHHNIRFYEYNKIKRLYDSIKRYKNNFNKFYYMATAIVIISSILFILYNLDKSILIVILFIVFFLFIESIRNLYYIDGVQKKIDDIIESIREDIKHIPKYMPH